jgi:hypothetical protein
MTSPGISADFKLLDFRYVNRAKYEYSDLEKVSPRLMISNCYYAYDATRKYLYYFETPRLRTLTEVYKVGDRFMLDLVVPLGSLFMDYLVSEDETNITATVDNSMAWFGSQIPPEIASEKYKSSLVLRSGGNDPVFRLNIPSYRGKPVLEVYDSMRRPIDISRIKPDMEIACICQKVGIRFSNTTFSGEYDCFKIKITQQQPSAPKIPTGYVFNDENANGEAEDEVDVRGYAERLVSSNSDLEQDEEYNGEDQESVVSLSEEELSDADSVLNDLEEVNFTDGESEVESGSETGGEENVSHPENETDKTELTDADLEGLEEVVVEEEANNNGEAAESGSESEGSEVELTDEDLEGLEEVVVASEESDEETGQEDIQSVDLDTGSEGEFDDLGLEELNIDGPVSVQELPSNNNNNNTNNKQIVDNEIDELGLEALDLTPSKKQPAKPLVKPQMAISELTDDFLDDI